MDEESIRITMVFIYCILTLVGGFCLYFVPSIIAYKKVHKYRFIILLINIFLGWTFIGWAGSLIWVAVDKENIEKDHNLKNINDNKYENLEKLQKLKDSGTITEMEFEEEKKKLLK